MPAAPHRLLSQPEYPPGASRGAVGAPKPTQELGSSPTQWVNHGWGWGAVGLSNLGPASREGGK